MTPVNWDAAEGFLYDEERALRDHLLGMTVTDHQQQAHGQGRRPVGVWFSHPDLEVREQKYPYILITLIDVQEATDRMMSWGNVRPPILTPADMPPPQEPEVVVGVATEGIPFTGPFVVGRRYRVDVAVSRVRLDGQPVVRSIFQAYRTDHQVSVTTGFANVVLLPEIVWGAHSDVPPTPVYLHYQVKSFSRNPRHNRDILTQITREKLPHRYGQLQVIDGTQRWMYMRGSSHQEAVEGSKRTLMTNFDVQVSSWAPFHGVTWIQDIPVLSAHVDMDTHEPSDIYKINLNTRPPGE